MKTVVASVLYQNAWDYYGDLLAALQEQDTREFDILFLVDDLEYGAAEKAVKDFSEDLWRRTAFFYNDERKPPYALRIELLEKAKEKGYDFLIFTDADDRMTKDRVRLSIEGFHPDYTFFYNEIRTFQNKRVMAELPKEASDIESIRERNFLGLSNTAVNLGRLSEEWLLSLYEGNTGIFDWYLFSRMLLAGAKGKKIENCACLYRIHESNLAGLLTPGKENIEREIEIKRRHYELLRGFDSSYENLYEVYCLAKTNPQLLEVKKEPEYWWDFTRKKREEKDV